MHRLLLTLSLLTLTSASASAAPPCSLQTEAEESGWIKTGRYTEVEKLARCFRSRFPGKVTLERFGTTPERRPMWALVVRDPSAGRRPVVYFQGGIHAGEIDGKDAGFALLRDVLEARTLPKLLKAVTLVFVPVLNVDGHERFGPNQRPNQRGPESMGWRVTAQNLNLNRDYGKLDSPELRAAVTFMRKWDPILAIDLHVTDGADFQNEVSVIVEPSLKGPTKLRAAAAALSAGVQTRLRAQGHPALPFYPEFETEDDPASGITLGVSTPRFFHGYWQLHNRIAILVETHSWKTYAVRVKATYDTLVSLLEEARKHADSEWRSAAREADAEGSARKIAEPNGRFALGWKANQNVAPETFVFPGYAYRKIDSPISGAKETVYDPNQKEDWNIPLWTTLKPKLEIEPPARAYVVTAGAAEALAPRLRAHGIQFETMEKARPSPEGLMVFRVSDATLATKSLEARTPVQLKGEWKREARAIPAGSLIVPIAQPLARLVTHLMEPAGADSFAAWGFFNGFLEQKEYMEPYIVHQAGVEALARDPALKAEFETRLANDATFRGSAELRREFFYQRHPAWDERYRMLPIWRY